MEGELVAELDTSGCADALAGSLAAVVAAEVRQIRLVAHWCDLHSGTPAGIDTVGTGNTGRGTGGRERSVALGGEGTPRVSEFAAGELGLLLEQTTTGARHLMRDVLDLRHRHPRLWAAVLAGRVRFFAARHVVRATRAAGLTATQAGQVDARVAAFLGNVPWGRMEGLVEAAVIAVDPEGAEQRRMAAELARFVRTGRSNEYGTQEGVSDVLCKRLACLWRTLRS